MDGLPLSRCQNGIQHACIRCQSSEFSAYETSRGLNIAAKVHIKRQLTTTDLSISIRSKHLHTTNAYAMKTFLRTKNHSKTSSITSHSTTGPPTHSPFTPTTPTQWWLARENAFDTASRVYKKLYRPDSDTSYYSREQDYDEDEDEEARCALPLSPSSPEWNASRWFWSVERSEMWVEHVASSGWSADAKAMVVTATDAEVKSDAGGRSVNAAGNSQHEQEEGENSQESKAEVKSIAAELSRRPKLTIQIPNGTPGYYANHGPNDYSSCRPHITSDERAEWKKNMF
jgi:hypothetical protein